MECDLNKEVAKAANERGKIEKNESSNNTQTQMQMIPTLWDSLPNKEPQKTVHYAEKVAKEIENKLTKD